MINIRPTLLLLITISSCLHSSLILANDAEKESPKSKKVSFFSYAESLKKNQSKEKTPTKNKKNPIKPTSILSGYANTLKKDPNKKEKKATTLSDYAESIKKSPSPSFGYRKKEDSEARNSKPVSYYNTADEYVPPLNSQQIIDPNDPFYQAPETISSESE